MWNYRVVRKNPPESGTDTSPSTEHTFGIHEAYYAEDGRIYAVTQDPVEPFGETLAELRHGWVMMAEAFAQPIVDFDAIPEPASPPPDETDETVAKRRHDPEEIAHERHFLATPTLRGLIDKLIVDYQQNARDCDTDLHFSTPMPNAAADICPGINLNDQDLVDIILALEGYADILMEDEAEPGPSKTDAMNLLYLAKTLRGKRAFRS